MDILCRKRDILNKLFKQKSVSSEIKLVRYNEIHGYILLRKMCESEWLCLRVRDNEVFRLVVYDFNKGLENIGSYQTKLELRNSSLMEDYFPLGSKFVIIFSVYEYIKEFSDEIMALCESYVSENHKDSIWGLGIRKNNIVNTQVSTKLQCYVQNVKFVFSKNSKHQAIKKLKYLNECCIKKRKKCVCQTKVSTKIKISTIDLTEMFFLQNNDIENLRKMTK